MRNLAHRAHLLARPVLRNAVRESGLADVDVAVKPQGEGFLFAEESGEPAEKLAERHEEKSRGLIGLNRLKKSGKKTSLAWNKKGLFRAGRAGRREFRVGPRHDRADAVRVLVKRGPPALARGVHEVRNGRPQAKQPLKFTVDERREHGQAVRPHAQVSVRHDERDQIQRVGVEEVFERAKILRDLKFEVVFLREGGERAHGDFLVRAAVLDDEENARR